VFLELHVKVRKDWRNNELYLKEYGYWVGAAAYW
jgi:GTPase Era involved in 16S rRNA processing